MKSKFEAFIEELATTEVSKNVHNQYSYEYLENSIRRDNLLIYLNKMKELKPKTMLLAEAPGYRGSRLTGVPFTSEDLLMNNIDGLDLFGKSNGYRLAKDKDKLLKQATTTIIWNTLVKHDFIPLAWNTFPFHPFKENKQESNRTPLKKELLIGEKFIVHMMDMFEIENIVAVGNKAEESLRKLGIDCIKVRHPAQGGKNEFVRGIEKIIKNY